MKAFAVVVLIASLLAMALASPVPTLGLAPGLIANAAGLVSGVANTALGMKTGLANNVLGAGRGNVDVGANVAFRGDAGVGANPGFGESYSDEYWPYYY